MRVRRNGDPNATRKRGRKQSEFLALNREFLSEWSPRTLSRYAQAMSILGDVGGREAQRAALKAATRPNGTVNVAKLLKLAEEDVGERSHRRLSDHSTRRSRSC